MATVNAPAVTGAAECWSVMVRISGKRTAIFPAITEYSEAVVVTI